MIKKAWGVLCHYWQLGVAIVMIFVGLGFQLWGPNSAVHWIVATTAIALTLPIVVRIWQDFRTGSYGLNILGIISIIAAVALHQYWAALVMVTLLEISEIVEQYATRRAQRELQMLLQQTPQTARLVRGRKQLDVAASDVHRSDKIRIEVGEIVPVDAIILEGEGSFDESFLTGENQPVTRGIGEQILSGSINLDGSIVAKALHSANDSQFEQLVKLLRNAGAKQAPFSRMAERYSIPFTITAIAIAVAAWVVGHRAIRFLDVMVVATPWPLLIAAPIALMSGMHRASRFGIFIKTAAGFEKLADAKSFVFDESSIMTSARQKDAKNTIKQAIDRLKTFGISEVLMTTTEREAAVRKAANEVGITSIKAEASQADTLHAIDGMTERPVVFVGDGEQDAPALTAADVGIALAARGSIASVESADIIVMSADLDDVVRAVSIARRSFSIARQSITLGTLISLVLMLTFATGALPVLLGVALHALVDMLIVCNALRAHTSKEA